MKNADISNQGFLDSQGKVSAKWVYVQAVAIGGVTRLQELVALFDAKGVLEKFFLSDNPAHGARLGW